MIDDYSPLVLPKKYDEMNIFIEDNKVKLIEHVVSSIQYALENKCPAIEVFNFENTDFSVIIKESSFKTNIESIFQFYLEKELYEFCGRVNKIKELLIPIVPEIKEIEIFEDNKSYTLNKKYIYLCTKDKNGEYYKTNTIVYVLLHEMAHYLNKIDIGHTEHFYKIFNELLDKAEKIGIYNPKINIEKNYCGYKT